MSGRWDPIRAAHAIEVVGASFTFVAPLNDTQLRRALRMADKVSAKADLPQRDPITGIQVNIQAIGGPRVETAPINGVSFKRNIAEVMPAGVATAAAEELVIERQSIIYRTREYGRWKQFREKLTELVSPVLDDLLGSTTIQNARLEYRDVFIFQGSPTEADTRNLLRQGSPYVAPHVFDQKLLWHSHTGMFISSSGAERRLIQINIDANDLSTTGGIRRSVSIMTGVQDNFAAAGIDADDQKADQILDRFDGLHSQSKELFTQIVCDEIAKRIGLQGTS